MNSPKLPILVPPEALQMDLDPYSFKVFCFLIQNSGMHISTRRMAKVLDMSRKRVGESLNRLVAMTMVAKERHQITSKKYGYRYSPLPTLHWFYAYDPTPVEINPEPELTFTTAWT